MMWSKIYFVNFAIFPPAVICQAASHQFYKGIYIKHYEDIANNGILAELSIHDNIHCSYTSILLN